MEHIGGSSGKYFSCHSTRDKWREGRGRRDEQRAGRRWDGVRDTLGFKPSLGVLVLLALLILDDVIFKLDMNSNLIVQKYILHLE